jgi:hypothetical protein
LKCIFFGFAVAAVYQRCAPIPQSINKIKNLIDWVSKPKRVQKPFKFTKYINKIKNLIDWVSKPPPRREFLYFALML